MKKYILPVIGIAAGIGFTGLVAYATVHTTPAPIAEIIEGQQEDMVAGIAAMDTAPAPVQPTILPEQQTSVAAKAFSTTSEPDTPSPSIISQPEEATTQPDEPVTYPRYEDDEDEDEDEDEDD